MQTGTEIAPYGSWESPVSAQEAAVAGGSPEWVDVSGGELWWAESRPAEGGRVVLVRRPVDGERQDVLPDGWNVRNRIHEYGARPWTVLGTQVAFTHWGDQRVYLADVAGPGEVGPGEVGPSADGSGAGGSGPVAISPEPEREHGLRYGDLLPGRDGEVWCVRETVTGDRPADIRRDLVSLSTKGVVRVLGASHHFMSGPKLSPDGRHAAWIGWEHPAMPWDGSELCVAPVLEDGTFGPHKVVAGGAREAVCQVEWEDGQHLLALSDPDGWWNLYRYGIDGSVKNLAPCSLELGGALWRLGWRWFAPLGSGRHAVLDSGALAILDERSQSVTPVDTDLTAWSANLATANGIVYCSAGSPRAKVAVVGLDLSNGSVSAYTPQDPPFAVDYLPEPVERVFAAPDGREIPAYLYEPHNPGYRAPDGERPPYIVYAHGGPTGKFTPVLNMDFAYFTSRGIGIVAVNYGGSTGYGRAYREVLNGQWGVIDVEDCATVGQALADEGTADPQRLAIQGGSAGGWTSAASMTSVRTYRCATIVCPILDLTGWTQAGGETHDFESRYIEGLVGSLPEHQDRYTDRSPIHHVDKLAGPVLLLQGLEDEVCPPEQADRFVASLAGTGIPHAYLTFEGEQHGFRKAATLVTVLQAELSFYGQVFSFTPVGVPALELHK
ncbi:MAG: prolyl oligopeptidase family serine peptidase [Kibdelosporangium sp.]